jgi:hypothetical protein
MPQNFLFPQRDQRLLLPVDMREWLTEDDLVFVVLDAVATLDLGEFRRRYRADGHGRRALHLREDSGYVALGLGTSEHVGSYFWLPASGSDEQRGVARIEDSRALRRLR